MASRNPLKAKDITDLLSKLKAETPDYPSDLMAAKKAAFLKQAVNIKIDGKGQGGEGGQQGGSGGSGGSGTALGSGPATSSFLLQALVGISIVTAIFLAAYAYREQITDMLQNNEPVAREQSSQPLVASTPLAPGTVTAIPSSVASVLATSSVETVPSGIPGAVDNTEMNGASVIAGTPGAEIAADKIKSNNGLHLGQTPGTPAAPGQGNPGNINKPDKDKPDKPEKPEKPKKTK